MTTVLGMEAEKSMRTLITIDGERYLLASEEEVGGLKQRIEDAVQAGGRFVDISTEGASLSVLITSRSAVTLGRVAAAPDEADPPGIGLPDF